MQAREGVPQQDGMEQGRSVRAGTNQLTSEGARDSGAARRTNCQTGTQCSGFSDSDTARLGSTAKTGIKSCKQRKHVQLARDGVGTLMVSLFSFMKLFSTTLHPSCVQGLPLFSQHLTSAP